LIVGSVVNLLLRKAVSVEKSFWAQDFIAWDNLEEYTIPCKESSEKDQHVRFMWVTGKPGQAEGWRLVGSFSVACRIFRALVR
jgi:hypothetical protein